MLANADDVAECYRVVLNRAPENAAVVANHLARAPSVWDLVRTFINSEEFLWKLKGRSHLAINKCFEALYLARSLPPERRVACFLHHHDFLAGTLKPDALEAVYFRTAPLYASEADERLTIEMFAPRAEIVEGELCLALMLAGTPIYRLSFSFVPGEALGLAQGRVALISRMQGALGRREAIRAATKAMAGIHPQAALFTALTGLASAAGVATVAAVTARNQLCYLQKDHAIFEQTYDVFMAALEAKQPVEGLHVVSIPLGHKPLSQVSPLHRLRTRKRRAFKAVIADSAKAAWTDLTDRATKAALRGPPSAGSDDGPFPR